MNKNTLDKMHTVAKVFGASLFTFVAGAFVYTGITEPDAVLWQRMLLIGLGAGLPALGIFMIVRWK